MTAPLCDSVSHEPIPHGSALPPLSSRPERTRISCHAALGMAAYAAFRKESRMKFANATNLDRKSGVAEWRDLLCAFPERNCHGSHLTP